MADIVKLSNKDIVTLIQGLVNSGNSDLEANKSGYYIFQHDIEKIFDKVKEYSSYKSKFISTNNDISIFDRLALTDEEYNIWKQFIKAAGEDVHRMLGYISRDIRKTLIFDQGYLAPAWVSGTYPLGAYVSYTDGFNYKSLVANNTAAPTDATKWERQSRESTIPPYVAAQTYAIDDVVSYNGSFWISLANNNTGHTPVGGSTYWSALSEFVDTKNKITVLIYNVKNFDSNAASIMDDKIYQIYVCYTLKEWYKIVGLVNDYQAEEAKYQALLQDLRLLSFRRISPFYRTGTIL